MVTVKLQKKNDAWIIVVPNDEVERLGLDEGQEVQLSIQSATPGELSDETFDEMVDRLIAENRDALDYLAQ